MYCNWWKGKKGQNLIALSFASVLEQWIWNKWSCLKIDEDGDVLNKTIVSIQDIITESITNKREKEDLANKESNNEEGKGTKVFFWKMKDDEFPEIFLNGILCF